MKYFCLLPPSSRYAHHTALISTLQNNMTGCHVKVGNWEDAIDLCNSVLEIDSANVKALYRRGWSYIEIQEYEKASTDLLKAKQLDPENKAVKVKLAVLDERKKALNAQYAQAMKKLFS
jgi:FK506-binding protein 4/5